MQRSNSSTEFYFVDAESLAQVDSKKPHHLAKRFERSDSAHSFSHSDASDGETAAAAKRAALLQKRQERLRERSKHVYSVMHQQKHLDVKQVSVRRMSQTARAKSAEANRAHLMSSQARSSAQHVRRAKEIARKHSLMTQEKIEQFRRDLTHKMTLSDLRRQELLKRNKSAILEDVDLPEYQLTSEEKAAIVIQRHWRRHLFKPLISAYRKTGISIDSLSDMPLPELMKKMQEPALIDATQKLLAGLASTSKTVKSDKHATKVFLTSYVIVAHPHEIFAEMGDNESDLRDSANTLLTDMHVWVANYKTEIAHALRQNVTNAWVTFYDLFEYWRTEDTETILKSFRTHYLDLEKLWYSVREQEDALDEWLPKIQKQKEHIRRQVIRVAGKDALPAWDEETIAEIKKVYGAVAENETPHLKEIKSSVANAPYLQSEAKEEAVPADTLEQYGDLMTNERMAHELMMDPNYKLEKEENEMMTQVRQIARKALLDNLKAHASESGDKWFIQMASDIKSSMLSIVPETHEMARQIHGVYDLDLIKQQIEVGSFDVAAILMATLGAMAKIAAPIRDEAINLASAMVSTDRVEAAAMIMDILEDMRLDQANHRLQMLKPHLKQVAVEYETGRFETALKEGRIQLTNTKAWLKEAVAKVIASNAQRNPENIAGEANMPKFDRIYYEAIMDLLSKAELVDPSWLPETFLLDTDRLKRMQNELQAYSVVAAMLMLTQNVVPALKHEQQLLIAIKDLLLTLMESGSSIENLSAAIINEIEKGLSKQMSEKQSTLIKAIIEKTFNIKDNIFMMMNRRAGGAIREHMQKGLFNRDGLKKQGLDIIAKELEELSNSVFLMCRFNREVYAKWYDEVINAEIESQQ